MNYIKVLGIQLFANLDCDSRNEFLIYDEFFEEEMKKVKEVIATKKPDVVALPEMCYREDMYSYFKDLSKKCLVVAGSKYNEGINQTAIFYKGELHLIPKCNASGAEPMVRNIEACSKDDFMSFKLKERTFDVKGKKFVVLNCMEYYQNAYYIAREVPDLFGFVCICSNNNPKVFLDESRAIHNHRENIYTFMVNCVSTYKSEDYGKGESYVFGPIQGHEKEWLQKEGVQTDDHCSSILKMSKEPGYFYGEFMNKFSRFGRSDDYLNNPRNVEIKYFGKKEFK